MHPSGSFDGCRKKKLLVHSEPWDGNGVLLCGVAPEKRVLRTGYSPDADVLEPYMRGCRNCVRVFNAGGGKSVWKT